MTDALPIGTSRWELIEARAAATPDAAFVLDERGRAVTFARFRELAEEVASGLRGLGVDADHVVSWQLPSTLEACVLMAALCRLGVRQNPIIPILRRAEVSLITRQVGSRWLFVPGTYRGFDFVAMAHESVEASLCTVVDVSHWAGDAELSLPRADPSGLPPATDCDLGATVHGSATPFFMTYLAAQRAHGDAPFFPTLRKLHAGGAPITPELNAECLAVLGTPIVNQWGLTEFPAATSLGIDDPPEPYASQSVGRMAPGAELKIVGLDGEIVCPGGGEGELWVRGPQRCQGYVDASLDADAFDADGFFRTGDLGTVDTDGFVRITGRLKDVIIRNAENISALEIEGVLVEHPAIADVAVIGLPDPRTGERACAVVVLAPGHDTISIPELAAFCHDRGLSRTKTPEQIEIVDTLPRNPMGKVLKHVLRAEVAGS